MIGVPVICAETDERARWLSGPSALSFTRLRQGRPTQLPTPEEAAEYVFTPTEREIVRAWTAPLIRGEPAHVRTELEALAERTGADELMITTMIHGPADRLRSYELVAEAWDLAPKPTPVHEAVA
jgi:alkanesulfonate monooxygenase SsuD/methylene tetrahydromethanopterin reductase-like flavin-dependent oxidoreductase (luciferase family)